MQPLLRHHPHLLRERRARTSATPTRRSPATCSHAGTGCCGDEVFYLTGTDEHGLKVQRAAEAQGRRARRSSSTRRSRACSATSGTRSTSPTTTSSAPPSPATTRRCRSSCRRSTTRATSSSARTRACTACRARRTTPKTSSCDGNCPIHDRPGRARGRGELLLQAVALRGRLLEYYAEHPEAVQPESRLNEVLGFIRGGLQDFSMSRTSINWGVPLPWDPKHVAYVWADALFNYCTAVGYGDRRRALREVVAGRLPPRRQGHPALPRGVLARDADVGRARAAAVRVRARLVARRRREDERRRSSTRSRPPISSPTSASTASATTSWPTSASVPTATSRTRRWCSATTPISRTTSATSRTAC